MKNIPLKWTKHAKNHTHVLWAGVKEIWVYPVAEVKVIAPSHFPKAPPSTLQ